MGTGDTGDHHMAEVVDKDAIDDANEATSVKIEVPCLSSVAGPMIFSVFYYSLVIAAVVLFIVALIPLSDKWSSAKISRETVILDTLEYPDIYMCMSPQDTMTLLEGYGWSLVWTDYFASSPGSTVYDDRASSVACNHPISLVGQCCVLDDSDPDCVDDPDAMVPFESPRTCPLPLIGPNGVNINGCAASTEKWNTNADGEIVADTDLASLNELTMARSVDLTGFRFHDRNGDNFTVTPGMNLQFQSDVTAYKPLCRHWSMTDAAKVTSDGEHSFAVGMFGKLRDANNRRVEYSDSRQNGFQGFAAKVEIYFVGRGESPVKDGNLTVVPAYLPLFGYFSQGSLVYSLLKDETRGDSDFVPQYKYDGIDMKMDTPHGAADSIGIWTLGSSFTVDKIHISDHSWADVYTDLGGLWAASLFILALFFSSSGKISSKGRPLLVFSYLPDSIRSQYLSEVDRSSKVDHNDGL